MSSLSKFKGLFLAALFVPILACTRTPETGPVEIKYDRDKCSECGMVISDDRFAAEIRGGKDRSYHAHKFDDVGCAMKFSKKQSWFEEKETEFYVMDYEAKKWISPMTAKYKKVKASPMGYGYSAHEKGDDKSVAFDDVMKSIGE